MEIILSAVDSFFSQRIVFDYFYHRGIGPGRRKHGRYAASGCRIKFSRYDDRGCDCIADSAVFFQKRRNSKEAVP